MANQTCPKCSYQRTAAHVDVHPGVCPACGIAYAKWRHKDKPNEGVEQHYGEDDGSYWVWIKDSFMYCPSHVDPLAFWSRAVVLVLFGLWGLWFIVGGVDWERIGGSFLHNVNLPFHEFGHVLFSPFGEFMMILGGSLFQICMPLGIMIGFVFYQRDTFGGAIMLWWTGQNFIDVSPYIADAPSRSLPLILGMGEEAHDWGNLLTMTNSLGSAGGIASTSFFIGSVLIFISLVWGVYLLVEQKKHCQH